MMGRLIAGILGACVTLGFGALFVGGTNSMANDAAAKRPLVHNVFFTLKDGSAESIQKLTDACHKYLNDHPGVIFFAAGPVVPDLSRPVNQKDFHVALCVVFDSREAHDIYQTAPRHLEFIAENKPTWETVRVFDSYDK